MSVDDEGITSKSLTASHGTSIYQRNSMLNNGNYSDIFHYLALMDIPLHLEDMKDPKHSTI